MVRSAVFLLLAAAYLLAPTEARGQPGSLASVTRSLLDQGRSALNNLQFPRADSLAREVLRLGDQLPRAARIESLQLIAASNFAELQPPLNVAQARSALAALLRIDLAATLPPDLSWRGLDSLYTEVAAETYAISVLARRDNPIEGIDGTAMLRVRANRPSSFVLIARSQDGVESIPLDSVTSALDTTLALRVGREGALILRGGPYEFVVRATEIESRESVTRTFDGVAVVPAIDYLPIHTEIDSTQLLPERSKPQRSATIIGGVLLGAATMAIGKGLRAGGSVNVRESDTRYRVVSLGIVVAAAGAAAMDRGRVLDKNVAINRGALAFVAAERARAAEENAKRAINYRASIALNTEPR